jgi:hypothetical protein
VEAAETDFGPPAPDTPRADTAGLPPEGEQIDRPGPSAAIEIPAEEESSDEDKTEEGPDQ